MKRIVSMILAFTISVGCLVGCSSKAQNNSVEDNKKGEYKDNITIKNQGDPIVVRTMVDTEGQILGKMMVMLLKESGYEVSDFAGTISGAKLGRTSLLEKQTDIYLEYTGNAMFLAKEEDKKSFSDMEMAYKLAKQYDEKNGLTWLEYAHINNTDAVCVTKKFSEENNVKNFYDLAKYINSGKHFKLAMHGYFEKSKTCLAGLEEKYKFKLKDDQKIVMSGIEQAVAEGTDGIVAGHIFGTSGYIKPLDLVVLDDPEKIAPVYSPCPLIRTERLDKYKEIKSIIDPLFKGITLEEQLEMNSRLQADGDEPEVIAREYLIKKGLLKK